MPPEDDEKNEKENKSKEFQKEAKDLPPGERVARIKETAKKIANENGWVKDNQLSRINNRDVYKSKDGDLYSLDTQHGQWERINPKSGNHKGAFDLFDQNKQVKPVDISGGHNLKVK